MTNDRYSKLAFLHRVKERKTPSLSAQASFAPFSLKVAWSGKSLIKYTQVVCCLILRRSISPSVFTYNCPHLPVYIGSIKAPSISYTVQYIRRYDQRVPTNKDNDNERRESLIEIDDQPKISLIHSRPILSISILLGWA